MLMDRDGGTNLQVPKVVWWRRYLPDVLVMLLLLILARPHTPVPDAVGVSALLLVVLEPCCAGGMTRGSAVRQCCWHSGVGWAVASHVEIACEMIFGLIRPWLPAAHRVKAIPCSTACLSILFRPPHAP